MSITSNFIKKYFLEISILKCNPTRSLNPIVAFISADPGAVPGVPATTAAPPVYKSGAPPDFLEFDRIPTEKPSGQPPRPNPGPEFPRPPSPSPPTPEGPRPPMPSPPGEPEAFPPHGPDVIPPKPPERGPTPPDIPPSYMGFNGLVFY